MIKKVYVVLRGRYSDIHVDTVFSNKTTAEMYVEEENWKAKYYFEEVEMEEYTLNTDLPMPEVRDD